MSSLLVRVRALLEVVLCSGFPTQIVIGGLLHQGGVQAFRADQSLNPAFVFALSLLDTAVLLLVIVLLIRSDGDSPRRLFLGEKPVGREAVLGAALLPLTFGIVLGLLLLVQTLAPSLRNVPVNPFEALLKDPLTLAGFVVLTGLAGGLREELQRAFLLDRFERYLGGAWVGLAVTSIGFGLGHTLQGYDAALVTGVLGLLWGVMYLARRSTAATVTNHALFNATQLLIAAVSGRVVWS